MGISLIFSLLTKNILLTSIKKKNHFSNILSIVLTAKQGHNILCFPFDFFYFQAILIDIKKTI